MGARSTLHGGDGPCEDCGTPDNIVWFTDSAFWNNVMWRHSGLEWGDVGIPSPILCLPCFIKRAEAVGYRPTGWHVSPEWPWRRDDTVSG